jgi:hypothetical protein
LVLQRFKRWLLGFSASPDEGVVVERGLKRKLVIGVAGLAVLGGGGAAYAVTKSKDNERQAYLGDVAKRLNVTPEKLNSALKGAFEDRLDAAVKAGRLTQAQADKIKKGFEQNGGPPVGPGFAFGAGGPGGPKVFRRFGGPIHNGLEAAAKYLDLTTPKLIDQLRSGKSLADIAGDQNKSVDGLKSAIKDDVKSHLDADVKAGGLQQSDENDMLRKLDDRLDEVVNHKGLAPRERGFHTGGPAWGAKKGGGNRPGSFVPPPDAPAPPPGVPII